MDQSDIIFNILLNTHIDNITLSCLISNKYNKICNTEYFWIDKFKYDNIPILIDVYPTTISKWIVEYKRVKYCFGTTKDILIINKIEKNRINDKTDGTISINLYYFYDDFSKMVENKLMIEINKLIHNTSVNRIIHTIKMRLLQDNNYKIIYRLRDEKNDHVVNINYTQVIKILVVILYHEPLLEISDEDQMVIFIPKTISYQDFSWYMDDQKKRYLRRQSLWDALEYFKINHYK